VFNADESVLTDVGRMASLAAAVASADSLFLDAKMEQELLELDEEFSMELLESIGQTEPGLQALARKGFHTLGLQTYLTEPVVNCDGVRHDGEDHPQRCRHGTDATSEHSNVRALRRLSRVS